jgi:D-glycerate 3-kinase
MNAHDILAPLLTAAARRRPGLVVGLCAPQASGKTTASRALERTLAGDGLRCATLSLDDIYLPHRQRETLAREVHPLLVTRGPPGTHDVERGAAILDALRRPGAVSMPRFDKAADDRAADEPVDGPADLILFEGWCIGARPQPEAALVEPVNALEGDADPDGRWRRWVNDQLAGPYQALFARLDLLVLLQPPGFETVVGWRTAEEGRLRARTLAETGGYGRTMDDAAVARFMQHYERLTRWILSETPDRADVLIALDPERRATLVHSAIA